MRTARNRALRVILLICISSFLSFGQSQAAKPDLASWYTAREVAGHTWCIDDHGSDNMYLVEGNEKALLVDTGLGVGRLREFVQTITRLPIIVVNTHGHTDHAGGNNQFASVYAHPLEFDAAKEVNTPKSRKRMADTMARGASAKDVIPVEEAMKLPPARLVPLKDGQTFDLGGRTIEVIETPGHTPGEVVLLDRGNRLLFSGDNDNVLVWLFLPTCTPLEVYQQSLQKLQKRAAEFDTILPGHGMPLPAAFIGDQIACVRSILDGTCKGSLYKSFAGDGLVCRSGTASVAFNPNNLRKK